MLNVERVDLNAADSQMFGSVVAKDSWLVLLCFKSGGLNEFEG